MASLFRMTLYFWFCFLDILEEKIDTVHNNIHVFLFRIFFLKTNIRKTDMRPTLRCMYYYKQFKNLNLPFVNLSLIYLRRSSANIFYHDIYIQYFLAIWQHYTCFGMFSFVQNEHLINMNRVILRESYKPLLNKSSHKIHNQSDRIPHSKNQSLVPAKYDFRKTR